MLRRPVESAGEPGVPAERECAGDQGLVAADRGVGADLEERPASLLVALLDPVPDAVDPHDLCQVGGGFWLSAVREPPVRGRSMARLLEQEIMFLTGDPSVERHSTHASARSSRRSRRSARKSSWHAHASQAQVDSAAGPCRWMARRPAACSGRAGRYPCWRAPSLSPPPRTAAPRPSMAARAGQLGARSAGTRRPAGAACRVSSTWASLPDTSP